MNQLNGQSGREGSRSRFVSININSAWDVSRTFVTTFLFSRSKSAWPPSPHSWTKNSCNRDDYVAIRLIRSATCQLMMSDDADVANVTRGIYEALKIVGAWLEFCFFFICTIHCVIIIGMISFLVHSLLIIRINIRLCSAVFLIEAYLIHW